MVMDNLVGIWQQAQNWLMENAPLLLVIVVATWLSIIIVRKIVRRWAQSLMERAEKRKRLETKKRIQTMSQLTVNVITIALLVIAIVMLLGQMGINVGPILAAAGVFGIALGFGAQSLVKDVITGLFMLVENQFNVGDVITVAGVTGIVEKSTIRITELRDLEGKVHFVPNGQISVVSNLTKEWSRSVLDIGVAYKEDIDRVIDLLVQVGDKMWQEPEWSKKLLEPMVVLGVDQFADSAVIIKVMFKTVPLTQWEVGREYRRRVKNLFDKEGVEIPFPHRTLYLGSDQDWTVLQADRKPEAP